MPTSSSPSIGDKQKRESDGTDDARPGKGLRSGIVILKGEGLSPNVRMWRPPVFRRRESGFSSSPQAMAISQEAEPVERPRMSLESLHGPYRSNRSSPSRKCIISCRQPPRTSGISRSDGGQDGSTSRTWCKRSKRRNNRRGAAGWGGRQMVKLVYMALLDALGSCGYLPIQPFRIARNLGAASAAEPWRDYYQSRGNIFTVGICFDPYSRVALDTFIQRSQEPIHALGEVH